MTQGKIERYHRSMKSVIKLQNYYYPWELEQSIEFVEDERRRATYRWIDVKWLLNEADTNLLPRNLQSGYPIPIL